MTRQGAELLPSLALLSLVRQCLVPYVVVIVFVILAVVFAIAHMTILIDFIQWRSQHSLNEE